ncbi:unnamed protein product [Schistosoma curassoni]|uniref:Secreted protein n=1 Tax=Schistosoma curassoni TaxID=6186 RepID=A0A183K1Q2_9TREM|nr:unnamed protein product [Schistosoma curassoni]
MLDISRVVKIFGIIQSNGTTTGRIIITSICQWIVYYLSRLATISITTSHTIQSTLHVYWIIEFIVTQR